MNYSRDGHRLVFGDPPADGRLGPLFPGGVQHRGAATGMPIMNAKGCPLETVMRAGAALSHERPLVTP